MDLGDTARFCPRCGTPLAAVDNDSDAQATTAWTFSRPGTLDDDVVTPAGEHRRRANWPLIAGLGGAGILATVVVALALTHSATPEVAATSDNAPAAQPAPLPAARPATTRTALEPSEETWWIPPRGKRTDVEALGEAFPTIDERDLGAMFDADLKPIYGAPNLFEDHAPKHVRRDEMTHALIQLRTEMDLQAGFNFLFLQFGTHRSAAHEYLLYRAMQVKEVVAVNESKRMHEPPKDAAFYLAEVHRGAAYDMLVEGDYDTMGSSLTVILQQGSGSAESLQTAGNYKVHMHGLGLRPTKGDAIFAMTPDQVAHAYETTGEPVAVKLVFRSIPGRKFKQKELAHPKILLNQALRLGDGDGQTWNLAPGTYALSASSTPNGLGIQWGGDVTCDPPTPASGEHTSVHSTCTVTTQAVLQVSNPTSFGLGPDEQITLKLASVPSR
ncbi:MAG: hypothetical protein H6709_10545 [Kofleriaceae bacterium]|nr:hypothetical protein [Myxococcales bacterium]MCB9564119.1 hypothetical protein [Kofleriaceae bacterium]MCB9572513.1 hypothetical protein [Kofleriaceae bacterium]